MKALLILQAHTGLQYKPGLSSQRREADSEFRRSEYTAPHDDLSCSRYFK